MATTFEWACALEESTRPMFGWDDPCKIGENDLFNSVTADSINQKGLKVNYYIVSMNTKYDPLFKEDRIQWVLRKFYIMIYTPDYPSKLRTVALEGIINPERLEVTLSMDHFIEASTYNNNTPNVYAKYTKPKIGDLIFIPAVNTLFRIIQIRDTDQQFHFTQHTWILTLAQFVDNKIGIEYHETLIDDPIYQILTDNKPKMDGIGIEENKENLPLADGVDGYITTENNESIWQDNVNNVVIAEEGFNIIPEEGRDKFEHLRKDNDIFDDRKIDEKLRPRVVYEPRKNEKPPKDDPRNPFDGW